METTVPLLIDSREAGKLLLMLPARVTRLAKRGDIPCVILPDGGVRFLVEDLRSWVDSHRRLVGTMEGHRDD